MRNSIGTAFLRRLTSNLLISAIILTTAFGGTNSTQDQRQRDTTQRRDTSSRSSSNEEPQQNGFVTVIEGDKSVCRDMTPVEVEGIKRDPQQVREMRIITQDERNEVLGRYQSEAVTEVTGLKIVLRSTAQLDGFPLAKAAFIRAAAAWEAQIKNPITIVIDVDYGPTRFGQTYPTGVLGSASTPSYSVSYSTIRGKLVSGATNVAETALYNSLPASSVGTDIGAIGNTSVSSPLMRVFGLLAANADPATETNAPSIGFNSSFAFDFDPSDGIAADTRDFDAVAVHEMGHALGFVSNVGYYELYASSTKSMTVWDIFRFRPGTTLSTFPSALRVMSSGGDQRFFDGHPELATSTGRPDGSGGDGRQASHWKADEQSANYVGIMDPSLSAGVRKAMTNNDLQMLETIGYQVTGLAPANCSASLSAAGTSIPTSGGNGTVDVLSSCAWNATSDTAWITITLGSTGSGNGTVGFSVQPHTGTTYRAGSITIAGQPFTVIQNACSYTLSYSTTSFPATASNDSVTVTASGTTCLWTAVSNSSWITINSGSSATGSGVVNYSLAANTSTTARSGSITIAGQTFTVTQAGQPVTACSYSVGAFNTALPSSSGGVNITVTTTSACKWKAIENVSWLSFSNISTITGTNTVRLSYTSNTSTSSRSTVITIAGKNYTITQARR